MQPRPQTDQEVYDFVIDHLRTQGRRAIDDDHQMCLYRTEDGLKCAVGCLIPDEEYNPDWEGKNFFALTGPRRTPSLQGLNVFLIAALQGLHDAPVNWTSEGIWEFSVRAIANQFNLIYTPPPP